MVMAVGGFGRGKNIIQIIPVCLLLWISARKFGGVM